MPVQTGTAVTLTDVRLDHLPSYTELAEVVLGRAERAFGRRADGMLLERYALEAAINVLSTEPPRLYDFLPDLALREVRDALDRDAA